MRLLPRLLEPKAVAYAHCDLPGRDTLKRRRRDTMKTPGAAAV